MELSSRNIEKGNRELSTEQVLKRNIPWESYMSGKLISSSTLQLLRRYDHRPEDVQAALLDENGATYVRVFLGILNDITKEETTEYMVAIIDDMLSVNPRWAQLFHDKMFEKMDIYQPFLRLLSKKNWFLQEKGCKILSLVISAKPRGECSSNGLDRQIHSSGNLGDFSTVLKVFVDWICSQLRRPFHPLKGVPTAVSALSTLLKLPHVRVFFVQADGIKLLAPLIAPESNQQYTQMLYEATLCIWLLSFYPGAMQTLKSSATLPRLIGVVKNSIKEKVVRVAVLSLKNLASNDNGFLNEMIELGLPKLVQSLKFQSWIDQDLTEALDCLEGLLGDNIKKLSSFEKYKKELLSENLHWTPIHKDLTFWHDNVSKFEENDFQVLRILITILDTSRDPKTLAVACFDMSQFLRTHPCGRGIIVNLKAKDRLMHLMAHENAQVRKEALSCVQNLLLSPKYVSFLQQ